MTAAMMTRSPLKKLTSSKTFQVVAMVLALIALAGVDVALQCAVVYLVAGWYYPRFKRQVNAKIRRAAGRR